MNKSSMDTFTMKDGRKVTVDFTNTKSCLSVSKEDWKEIQEKLQTALEFINSDQYEINFFKSLGY